MGLRTTCEMVQTWCRSCRTVEAEGAAVAPTAQRAGRTGIDRASAVAVHRIGEFAAQPVVPGVAAAGPIVVDGTETVAVRRVREFAAWSGVPGVTGADPVDVDGAEVVALRLPTVLARRAGKVRVADARAVVHHDAVAATAGVRICGGCGHGIDVVN